MVFGLDLSGRMAVVTGAGGILCGMFARTLAQAGASVALLDINLETAERTAREIRAQGGNAAAYEVDVMDKATRPAPTHPRSILKWGILRRM